MAEGLAAQAFWTLGGAAASSALVLAVLERPWRGRGPALRGTGPGAALALGTLTGFVLSRGWPSFPPAQAVQWVFYLALVGGGLAFLGRVAPRSGQVGSTLVALLLPWTLLGFQRRHWTTLEGGLWSVGLAAFVFFAARGLLGLEAKGRATLASTLGLALATALAAASHGLGGGALFALLAASLALATGLCALAGWWRGGPALGSGGAQLFLWLFSALLWLGHWLNELSWPSFCLLSLVPIAGPIAARLCARHPRCARGLEFLGPVALAGAALAWEFAQADLDAYG